MTAFGAAASEGPTAEAAREALTRGNAVDAVVTGILVAAVASPGVLLGPVQILVGGAGAGLFAVDGRVRQPGKGVPRPRGFLPDEAIPETARMAVPLLPSALASALGSAGTLTLHRAAAVSLSWARSHAPDRVRVAEALTRLGPAALTEGTVADDLLAVGGRVSRGLLTPKDLAAARPGLHRVDADRLGSSGIVRPPWDRRLEELSLSHPIHVVVAADARGLFAIASYESALEGIPIASLGLIAPFFAAPVLRGRPRVSPGDPRPAPVPLAMRAIRGVVDMALGICGTGDLEATLDGALGAIEAGPPGDMASAVPPSSRTVGLVRAGGAVRVVGTAARAPVRPAPDDAS